ncbi:MAG: NAD(P)-dependent oxidoreductase [Endomicrobium sp.]|jgi:nucleoside-diphosphate-sugar epimerase|nr:NAD(P)-dependent oxidoreductase [Endomicrobium sp.]
MKILLTGAAGFLGSYLLKEFIKRNHKIIIIKRSSSDNFRIKKEILKTKVYDIDKCKTADIFSQNKDIDLIVHTATDYGRKGGSFLDVFKTNVSMPLELLDFAVKNKVKRFINTGTVLPLTDDKINRNYAISKQQFLQCLKEYSKDIDIANLSFDYIYGPYENKIKFLPFLIDNCMKNVHSLSLSPCKQKRDFIYIDDVIAAYIKIIAVSDCGFKEYDAGFGKYQSLKAAVLKIKRITKTKTQFNFGAIAYRRAEPMETKTNPKSLSALGWKPKVSFEDGIKEIIKLEYAK